MTAIRCTQRLLRRVGLPSIPPPPEHTKGILGDWYATILYLRRGPVVVCASERSLLPLVFQARDLKHLRSILVQNLTAMLLAIGASPSATETELNSMQPLIISNTSNPSMIGVLNNFIYQVRGDSLRLPELTPLERALRVSEAPYGPIGFALPRELALSLVEGLKKPGTKSRGAT
jgi:hypothetical protein